MKERYLLPIMTAGKLLIVTVSMNYLFSCSSPDRGSQRLDSEIVFQDARIVTMDEEQPEVTAIAISGERITAVGSFSEMQPLVGPETRVFDLDGRTIIPGLNETHIHVRDLGFEQHYAVNLEPARTVSDVQQLLRDRLSQSKRANWRIW